MKLSVKENFSIMLFKYVINTIRTFYLYLFSEWSSTPLRSDKIFKQYFLPVIGSLCDKDSWYKEAGNAGLFYSDLESLNFATQTFFEKKAMGYEELIDETIKQLNRVIKKSKFPRLMFLVWALRQPISPYGSWFSGVDKIYLLAQYLFARNNGATEAQAVHWAHKWLPFQPAKFLPPLARFLRKSGFGQFWSIVFYSIPRSLETFLTRPWLVFGTLMTIIFFIIAWPIASLRNVFISWDKT